MGLTEDRQRRRQVDAHLHIDRGGLGTHDRAVENLRAVELGQLGGDLSAGPVRQGEEDDVVPGEDVRGGGLQDPVGQGVQVRLQCAEALTGLGVGGDGPDLDLGVPVLWISK